MKKMRVRITASVVATIEVGDNMFPHEVEACMPDIYLLSNDLGAAVYSITAEEVE